MIRCILKRNKKRTTDTTTTAATTTTTEKAAEAARLRGQPGGRWPRAGAGIILDHTILRYSMLY